MPTPDVPPTLTPEQRQLVREIAELVAAHPRPRAIPLREIVRPVLEGEAPTGRRA